MFGIIGIVVVISMVFGGYTLAGGSLIPILAALPFEMMMIGGAATGAFIIANATNVIKSSLKNLGKVFKGAKWSAQDYEDLLMLMFCLAKVLKTKGPVGLEPHIENPDESAIFQAYPQILHDHFACDFICDTMRMVTMDFTDPHQILDVMDNALEKHHKEHEQTASSLQNVADALPALGIVAAVLGVIKTMASIDQPPAILGKMIGGALVGTFLGVFLAYGFVGPMAARLGQVLNEEHQFYLIIRDIIVALMQGNSPQVAVEVGRANVPSKHQPSFAHIEEAIGELPSELMA